MFYFGKLVSLGMFLVFFLRGVSFSGFWLVFLGSFFVLLFVSVRVFRFACRITFFVVFCTVCAVGYFHLWGSVFVLSKVCVVFVFVFYVLVCTTLLGVVWVVFRVVRLFVVSLFGCCSSVDQLLCVR